MKRDLNAPIVCPEPPIGWLGRALGTKLQKVSVRYTANDNGGRCALIPYPTEGLAKGV